MSFAGFNLETATRRGAVCWGLGRAEEMRFRIEEMFVERVEARVGETGISSDVMAWGGGCGPADRC